MRYEGTYNATLIPIAGMLTGMWSIMWIAMTVMTAFTMLGVKQKEWGAGWLRNGESGRWPDREIAKAQ